MLRIAAAIILLCSSVRLSFEALQLIHDYYVYLKDWENWNQVILFVASIFFASGAYVQCCVCVENWQWQLGALSVFLAWFDLVLFMKKLPLFGVYVVMYIQIIYTFLRFAFLALLFIIAFGLSFYMLFVQYSLPVSYVTSYHILLIICGEKLSLFLFHIFTFILEECLWLPAFTSFHSTHVQNSPKNFQSAKNMRKFFTTNNK